MQSRPTQPNTSSVAVKCAACCCLHSRQSSSQSSERVYIASLPQAGGDFGRETFRQLGRLIVYRFLLRSGRSLLGLFRVVMVIKLPQLSQVALLNTRWHLEQPSVLFQSVYQLWPTQIRVARIPLAEVLVRLRCSLAEARYG